MHDPHRGALGRQIECLRLIKAGAGDEVPFIQTVFSPLAQAKNLAGQERLIVHLRQEPAKVKAALEVITETTLRFVEAAKETGIAGIYYAVQLANYGLLSEAEYREFGEPYDRRILQAVEDCWFNLAHLHGRDSLFDLIAGYPVQALNWHDRESGPSLREGQARFPGAVCGGLEHWDHLLRGDPGQVRGLVRGRRRADGRQAAHRVVRVRGAGQCAVLQPAGGAGSSGSDRVTNAYRYCPRCSRATRRRREVRTRPPLLPLLRVHPLRRAQGRGRGRGE